LFASVVEFLNLTLQSDHLRLENGLNPCGNFLGSLQEIIKINSCQTAKKKLLLLATID